MTDQKRSSDETRVFTPKWNADGLVTAIAVDHHSGEILMLAHMNEAALRETLKRGEAVYWSRSRSKLWRKGETSGHVQKIREIRVDCDQDALLLVVEQIGAACHTGRRSCFYRRLDHDGALGSARLVFTDQDVS